jgi:hypothetical protein
MADDEGPFSVDIEGLERGGVHLRDISNVAAGIFGDLHNITHKYGRNLGGNGDVGKSFDQSYWPGADASETFLRDLRDLVDIHGSKTLLLGSFFGDVDDTASIEAGGTGHRR